MITNIFLNGFKSHINTSLDLSPLTILTGLNSSGKSSVIQALLILEQYSRGVDNPLLKGYGDNKDLTNPNFNNWSICAQYGDKHSICYNSIVYGNYSIIDFPNIIYVSAGRLGPQVSLNIKDNVDLDEKGENVLQCIDAFQDVIIPEILRHKEAEGNTFLFNLRAWLNTVSPDVEFDWKIQKETDSSFSLFNNHRANNVGFGLSYALPVIVAVLMGSIHKNSVVIIENPEAHLHPRGQVELGSLMVQAVKAGVQVIVETHSDHFFDGIRIAIKEQEDIEFCNKVCAYWFELDNERNTKFEKCTIDKYGRMPKWPKGMFDQFELNALKLM